MSFLKYKKYSIEIRNRFFLILFAWLICLNTCYYCKEIILFAIVKSNNSFLELSNKPYFIVTNVTEVFYVYFELVLFISNQIAIFVLIHQLFMFLSLGLYQFEFTKLKLLFKLFALSWLFSFILLIKLIVPFSWKFFKFSRGFNCNKYCFFFLEVKLNEYLHYFISVYYICLISCQFLTLLIIALTSLSKELKNIKAFRRLFYIIFIIFSTVITPPDILSQIFISSILILAYEITIFLKKLRLVW
uniref:SecY-independent transporter protein n=1 Tax=Durinskia baltica diatom endosymbiont TaxID=1079368 RepID=I6N5N4_9STRA|nr:SecY-independent transporter protein [Durinskia baltica diatom endosymbiont]